MKNTSKFAMFAILVFGLLAVTGPGSAQAVDPAGNVVVATAAATAFQRGSSEPAPEPGTYGTTGWISKAIPGFDFHGYGGSEYLMTTDGYIFHDTGSSFYDAAFQLPNGAVLSGVTFFYYDNNATDNFRLFMLKYAIPGNAPGTQTSLVSYMPDVTETLGWQMVYIAFAAPETIKDWYSPNGAVYYQLRVKLSDTPNDQSIKFGGVTLWYKLQVSPVPAVATFPNDVPTGHPFFRFVEALAAAGITGGCGTGSYCPDSPVTRGQMAVFLSVALGLHWPSTP